MRISCMRCIKVCPVHARRLNPVMLRTAESAFTKNTTHGGSRNSFYKNKYGRHAALPAVAKFLLSRGYPAFFLSFVIPLKSRRKINAVIFKKPPRYSLRLLLAYLVYIFTGGVLLILLPIGAKPFRKPTAFTASAAGRTGPYWWRSHKMRLHAAWK